MATQSNLEISHDGLINDVEEEMHDLISRGFAGDDTFLSNYVEQPRHFEKQNPDSTVISEVPAMYIWIDGINVDQAGLGGQSGKKIRNTFNLIGSYRYIISETKPQEDLKDMKKIGWWLLFWIIKNMDLNGKVSGNPEVGDLIIEPSWAMMGEDLKKVTSLEVQMKYPFTMDMRVSS